MTFIPIGWKAHRLDQLGFVGRGRSRHRPRNDPSLYGGPYPFIQTAEIVAADCYVTTYTQTYNGKGLDQSKMWDANTLCISIAGENTGETAILRFKACFPDSVIGFIADQDNADVKFVKYTLDAMKRQIKGITKGATQDNLSLEKLLSLDILTPPISIQHRISHILSAYDDLIENNLHRIKVLEEMAQSLYREWFVKFRFPGHQKVKMVDSPFGKIPEGWEVCALSDLIDFVKGVEPGSKNYQGSCGNGMVPFLRVGDLGKRESTIFVNCELVKDSVLRPEDIAVTMDGTVGIVRIGFEGGYSSGIRRVVIREPKRIGWAFVYQLLQSESIQGIIHAHAKGTTIKHASSSIGYMVFALPKTTLLEEFEKHAAPMLKQTLSLERRNEVLRRTRDLLLPKLISGELDVSELDITIPEANA